MRLDVRKYLFDVQDACRLLTEFSAGKTFDGYRSDVMLRSAVERQFGIVGEALSQMLKLDPGMASALTDTRRIIAFRNMLIHGYAQVSDEVVWGILQKNLPILRQEVEQLLSDENLP